MKDSKWKLKVVEFFESSTVELYQDGKAWNNNAQQVTFSQWATLWKSTQSFNFGMLVNKKSEMDANHNFITVVSSQLSFFSWFSLFCK